jgi:hypothetical protein
VAKCEEKVILIVTCSPAEKEAVLDVAGEHWPIELDIDQWFEDFNDYAKNDGALWITASGVTEAIRKRMLMMKEKPEIILFR